MDPDKQVLRYESPSTSKREMETNRTQDFMSAPSSASVQCKHIREQERDVVLLHPTAESKSNISPSTRSSTAAPTATAASQGLPAVRLRDGWSWRRPSAAPPTPRPADTPNKSTINPFHLQFQTCYEVNRCSNTWRLAPPRPMTGDTHTPAGLLFSSAPCDTHASSLHGRERGGASAGTRRSS